MRRQGQTHTSAQIRVHTRAYASACIRTSAQARAGPLMTSVSRSEAPHGPHSTNQKCFCRFQGRKPSTLKPLPPRHAKATPSGDRTRVRVGCLIRPNDPPICFEIFSLIFPPSSTSGISTSGPIQLSSLSYLPHSLFYSIRRSPPAPAQPLPTCHTSETTQIMHKKAETP